MCVFAFETSMNSTPWSLISSTLIFTGDAGNDKRHSDLLDLSRHNGHMPISQLWGVNKILSEMCIIGMDTALSKTSMPQTHRNGKSSQSEPVGGGRVGRLPNPSSVQLTTT